MNIEHRTLNVQHRIMYSVNLKKDRDGLLREVATKAGSESTPRNSAGPAFYKIDKAQRLQYSTFDVRRSMLLVRLEDLLLRLSIISYKASHESCRMTGAFHDF